MNHQISLEEIGMIPKPKEALRPQQIKDYAHPCGGCICNHCANSVECIDKCTGEAEFGCFICDECSRYDGKGTDNRTYHCSYYKITDSYANHVRKQFKALKQERAE